MRPSWEYLAHVLGEEHETASDAELAWRFGVTRDVVTRVRADLHLPEFLVPSPMSKLSPEAIVTVHSVSVQGGAGHCKWIGLRSNQRVPLIDFRTSALRVAFRMFHGREPEGMVRVTCVMKRCVAGAHLGDRPMREAAKAAAG
ncbi:hypothetical protein [Streptomyces sp. NBC_00425]|uniref:hypothetical protein n=1 Tax=Streptomyces sp. NBC_00425 TaxID=2975740 RepID=UPI002E212803